MTSPGRAALLEHVSEAAFQAQVLRCSISGCEGKQYARGWCNKHYQRWRKYGRLETLPLRTERERLQEKIREEGECAVWKGARALYGYGKFPVGGNRRWDFAHRVAWRLANGPIPPHLYVLHRCDNPPCVRIDHLFLGTLGDNSADMVRKGRSGAGERNSQAKLTATAVQEIRRRYADGEVTQRVLANEFGISSHDISSVISGKRWRG